jgi:filamin
MSDDAKFIKCQGANLTNGFAEGPNKFTILTNENHDVTKLQIGFEGPAQPEVKLVTKKDKTVDVTFITAVGGDYKIHVKYKDNYIHSSPFKCKIVGDVKASVDKVKSSGAIKEAKNNADNTITIDGREVGISGGLSAHMEGPSKPDLQFKNNDEGTVTVTYKPTAAGTYKLHLKFTHYHLPGSPFTITCK